MYKQNASPSFHNWCNKTTENIIFEKIKFDGKQMEEIHVEIIEAPQI